MYHVQLGYIVVIVIAKHGMHLKKINTEFK